MTSRGAAAGLVVLLAATACRSGDDAGVTVGRAQRATVVERVDAAATVVAKAQATVSSPADGRVVSLSVHDGERVRRGDVLLRISSPAARARLAEAQRADAAASAGFGAAPVGDLTRLTARVDATAESSFDAAETAAKQLAKGDARDQALAQVAAARAAYASSRAQAQQALAQLQSGVGSLTRALSSLASAQRVQTQAAVRASQAVVDGLVVRAPIAGVVQLGSDGAAAADPLAEVPSSLQGLAASALGGSSTTSSVQGGLAVGSPVSSGDVVATVVDASTLSLTAEVDETDVLLVRKGVRADVELDALPGTTFHAVVTSVGLVPEGGSGGGVTYKVRLSLGGLQGSSPRPGMSAVASLAVRTDRAAVAVPAAAVARDNGAASVWVRDDSGRARRHEVDLGAQGDELVAVREGLDAGAVVVVHGVEQVREGQKLPAP